MHQWAARHFNMSTIADQTSRVISQIERHARPHGRWIEWMARVGFFIKGAVYMLLGAMTLRAAMEARNPPDRSSVFRWIVAQPFGAALLLTVAAGLFGYALWRLIQAVLNPDDEPDTLKGYGKRLARLGSGIAYGGIGFGAVAVVMGIRRASGEEGVQDWTAWALNQPFGRIVLTGIGLGIVGRGVQQAIKAWSRKLTEDLRLGQMNDAGRKWATAVGRFGLLSRGLVFVIIGGFLVLAAVQSRPDEAKGLAGALAAVERAPYGPIVLGIVGAGLVSYGMFQLVEGRYREIAKP
jgi:hypothetical protein